VNDDPNAANKMPPSEATHTGNAASSSKGSIGPYRLLQKLGEGGMGEVWLAEQTTPIHRTVALKLIKAGMDTGAVVARFESERQALALMDHASIAKVFDAGSTPEGRPYFVMEYVSGIPITAYCDKYRLAVRERLELFILVCEGVQHAHQKAIIHRDLKPSNILVVLQDDKAVPKIIDFGLAKAMAQRLTERTLLTELGVMVGTPGYMSPEQADMTERNVDTRTDVYSLGVILYELLVGALPLDPKELREAGFEGMLRKIRDDDPLRPSTKIMALGGESRISAENRKEEPESLARRLRGDLDWITMKALEKDRTRRYGSPSDLAADLSRHLRDEPVLACPPSAAYRARKFVRRHRFGVGVSATAVLLLLGFAVAMTVQARPIAQERDRANLEAETSRRVTEFMTGMFNVADPGEARGNSVTAREILDKASKEIGSGLGKDPVLQARMMDTMGGVYNSLGLYSQSKSLLERALEIRGRILGPEHPDTLLTMRNLAASLGDNGDLAEAEKFDRKVLGAQRRVLGPRNPETMKTMNNLAGVLDGLGRYAEAEQLFDEALDIARSVMGPEDPKTLKIASNLSSTLTSESKYAEAEKLGRETLELERRAVGPNHPVVIDTMINLAYTLSNENQWAKAASMTRDALEVSRRVYGPEHPATLLLMNNLGACELEAGQYPEGGKQLREALAIERRVLGPNHPSTAITKYNLARVAAVQGSRDEALSLLRDAVEHGLAPSNAKDMEKEREFDSLRADPRFVAMVADLRKRYSAAQGKP
jgi:serine/threonine protein kinase/tetratricopeptide (TPR) repeat protein